MPDRSPAYVKTRLTADTTLLHFCERPSIWCWGMIITVQAAGSPILLSLNTIYFYLKSNGSRVKQQELTEQWASVHLLHSCQLHLLQHWAVAMQ